VEFQCPGCAARIEQTVQNRMLPRIECPKCKAAFRTQWASSPADLALPRGPALSERFESGRNFSNKLWNATRFVLMNLEDFQGQDLSGGCGSFAALEDRWLASRLASVTRDATKAIDEYKFAEAARILYAFAWDEFCSAYLELCKSRLADPALRTQAQSMLLLGLDTILRLLHPIMPFVTEEIWQHLREAAGGRRMPWDGPAPGPGGSATGAGSIMVAAWPAPPTARSRPKRIAGSSATSRPAASRFCSTAATPISITSPSGNTTTSSRCSPASPGRAPSRSGRRASGRPPHSGPSTSRRIA
jgi:valyl-tRNA synthetase